jgi:hypothetical protein
VEPRVQIRFHFDHARGDSHELRSKNFCGLRCHAENIARRDKIILKIVMQSETTNSSLPTGRQANTPNFGAFGGLVV